VSLICVDTRGKVRPMRSVSITMMDNNFSAALKMELKNHVSKYIAPGI